MVFPLSVDQLQPSTGHTTTEKKMAFPFAPLLYWDYLDIMDFPLGTLKDYKFLGVFHAAGLGQHSKHL